MTTSGKLVVLAGPTASGKTDITHRLALLYNAPVLSADSRQLYRGLRIGTAQPPESYTQSLPYFFVNEYPPEQRFTAMDFRDKTLALLENLFLQHPVVFLTGGSGLYIDSLLYPRHVLPDKDDAFRANLETLLGSRGLEHLAAMLQELSPDKAAGTDLKNPRRVMRALEILHLSKNASPEKLPPFPYPFLYLGLDPGRETLYANINRRTGQMIDKGLVEEVRSFMHLRNTQALQTVGYKEIASYIDGEYSLGEAVEKIKQHTRNYAKRQMTWFRKNKDIRWYSPLAFDSLALEIAAFAGKPQES